MAQTARRLCIGVLVAAATVIAPAGGARPARVTGLPPHSTLRAAVSIPGGTNLLVNAGAEVGVASVHGWDAVTIPGWQILQGLPTVVRYGTAGFVSETSPGDPRRGRQLFVGGAGGTAVLSQTVRLRSPAGALLPAGSRCVLSAWLGAGTASYATAEARLLSSSGRTLATLSLATVTPPGMPPDGALVPRRGAVAVPIGTSSVQVLVVLGTKYTNFDGPHAPKVGYDRAEADTVSVSVSTPVTAPPPLRPPPAHVPRYQHVFVVYMENEGFNQIVGNTRQAPFINSLLPHASLLDNFYAEEHPSDGNYLALAGGSTFGLPLTDPLEENPKYTIAARNLGDLVDAAHESWKGYLQSADGPCDDTVHGYYWDDDLPFLYFKDIRQRPVYCADHLVPLYQLSTDLRRAETTPSFSWISPNDCSDMESCGIKAGDDFLRQVVGEVTASPAWKTQRSLFVITFDEDHYNFGRPAQRVPTIVLGSDVRQGFVANARATHYSLLRTIEAALDLKTLTANDAYATPINDVFAPEQAAPAGSVIRSVAADGSTAPVLAGPVGAGPVLTGPASGARPAARGSIAFVANSASNSVTPIAVATGRPGRPIAVGRDPTAIAVSPDGRTVYVVNSGSGNVTPIDTATLAPLAPIPVGRDPAAVAFTPGGKTAYVANEGSDSVTPIATATGRSGPPIHVGSRPVALAIAPSGRTAYVVDEAGNAVTPIDTETDRAGTAIAVGLAPFRLAVTPNGKMVYVVDYGSDAVTPIDTATNRALQPIRVGMAPDAIALTPDGGTAYVVDGDSDAVTPIDTTDDRALPEIAVGYSPTGVGVSPSGDLVLVANTISGTLTPIDPRTERAGTPIPVGVFSYPTALSFTPDGTLAEVLGTFGGHVIAVDATTLRTVKRTKVGSYPVAVAFGGTI